MLRKMRKTLAILFVLVFLITSTSVALAKTNILTPKAVSNVNVEYLRPTTFASFSRATPAPFTGLWWQYEYMSVNGKPAYCIQFGVRAGQGVNAHTETLTTSSLNLSQQKNIQATLLYGLQDINATHYGYSWQEEYIATQGVIWLITTNYLNTAHQGEIIKGFATNRNGQVNNGIIAMCNEIIKKINTHTNVPSFASTILPVAPTYEMSWNAGANAYGIGLTDTNNVIGEFVNSMQFPSGVAAHHLNNNELHIYSNRPLNGESATLIKTVTQQTPSLLFLERVGYQTKLVPRGLDDPVRAYFKLSTKSVGNLNIIKSSEDNKVSNLQFRIRGLDGSNNAYNQIHRTNGNGQVNLTSIPIGRYEISEINTPNKYVVPANQTVTVNPTGTATVNFRNNLKKGNLNIVKTSEDGQVNNLQFRVRGLDGNNNNINGVYRTNGQGRIHIPNLIIGNYEVSEINIPNKYIQPSSQRINIQYGQTATVNFSNILKKGNLNIVKTSEDGKVDNLEFRVRGIDTNNRHINITTRTNQQGRISIPNLIMGRYEVSEINTPVQYLQPQNQVVNIQYGQTATVNFSNILKKGTIEINKIDTETKVPLQGVEFTIYNAFDDSIVEVLTTDINGYAKSKLIPYGDYYFKETKARKGYYPNPTRYDFVIRVDGSNQTYDIENKQQKGVITITNYGERLAYFDFLMTDKGKINTPVYEPKLLDGSVFKVYAEEDIVGADGVKYYTKGELVEELTTKDGVTKTKELYLGKYFIKQTIVLNGHFIGDNKGTVELEEDLTLPLIEQEIEFQNELQRIKITLTLDDKLTSQNEKPKEEKVVLFNKKDFADKNTSSEIQKLNVKKDEYVPPTIDSENNLQDNQIDSMFYSISLKKDIKDELGNVLLEKDSIVEFLEFKDNKATVKSDLPFGEFKLVQNKKVDGLISKIDVKPIDFSPMPQDKLETKEERKQGYTYLKGNLEIIKTTDNPPQILEQGYENEALKDVEFELYKLFTDGAKKVDSLKTDKKGFDSAKNLTYGYYALVEIKAPRGYEPLKEPILFFLSQGGETVKLNVKNEPRIGYILMEYDMSDKTKIEVKGVYSGESSNVNTGDSSNVFVFVLVLVVGLVGLMVVKKVRKRKE